MRNERECGSVSVWLNKKLIVQLNRDEISY
jgi:hypothetical protein